MEKVLTPLLKKRISLFLIFVFVFQVFYIQPIQASTFSSSEEVKACIVTEKESRLVNANNEKESFVLPANTPVTLKLESSITTKTVKVGEIVNFRVAYDVMHEGKVAIPAGSRAKAQITTLKRPRIFGAPGRISMSVESLVMPNGSDIKISSNELNAKGDSNAAIAWVCFGVSMVILWPLIFVPFLIKGKDVEIPVNTSIEAYTDSAFDIAN